MSSIPIPGTFWPDGMSSSDAILVVSEVEMTGPNQGVHPSRRSGVWKMEGHFAAAG